MGGLRREIHRQEDHNGQLKDNAWYEHDVNVFLERKPVLDYANVVGRSPARSSPSNRQEQPEVRRPFNSRTGTVNDRQCIGETRNLNSRKPDDNNPTSRKTSSN